MSHYILSLDIGTTSAKALAVQADGKVVSTFQQFYPTHYPQPGFAEQDPNEILKAIQSLVMQTTQHLASSPSAIVLSCAMHGLLAVDKEGQPLSPLLIWADTRSKHQANALKKSPSGSLIYQRTGTPIHPMSPLCKLLWMKDHTPEVFSKTFKFISAKEFILHHWTHDFVVDFSIASATGLFDGETFTWCDEALQTAAIRASQLSALVPPHQQLKLIPAVAQALHLPPETIIVVGASDGCLAQLGSQAMQEGDMTITVGTSGAVRVAHRSFTSDRQQRLFTFVLDKDNFICGGATNNGTVLLQWFSKEFDAPADLHELTEQVKEVPAGSDGLIVLPYWLGERAPFYHADARGVFFGASVHHTKLHFQRAVLEGICFQLRSVAETVEEVYGRQQRILLSGGIIRSARWLQILSDVMGRPLLVMNDHDASALGAAQLAFQSMGESMTLANIPRKEILPNLQNTAIYQRHYVLFQQLNQQLQPIFQHLNV